MLRVLAKTFKASDNENKVAIVIGLEFNVRLVEKDSDPKNAILKFYFLLLQLILDFLAAGNLLPGWLNNVDSDSKEKSSEEPNSAQQSFE